MPVVWLTVPKSFPASAPYSLTFTLPPLHILSCISPSLFNPSTLYIPPFLTSGILSHYLCSTHRQMRFLLELLLVAQAAYAIRIPFDVHTVPAYHSRNLHPRAVTPIKNQLNAVYITNITLGGRTIPVMLDTGR